MSCYAVKFLAFSLELPLGYTGASSGPHWSFRGGHSALLLGRWDPLGTLGQYLACFFLLGRSIPSHLFLPPCCLPATPDPHLEHGPPSLHLNLNLASSGCEDTMAACGVFRHLPVLGQPAPSTRSFLMLL